MPEQDYHSVIETLQIKFVANYCLRNCNQISPSFMLFMSDFCPVHSLLLVSVLHVLLISCVLSLQFISTEHLPCPDYDFVDTAVSSSWLVLNLKVEGKQLCKD